jgi:transposase
MSTIEASFNQAQQKRAEAHQQCDDWNRQHPPGTRVMYHELINPLRNGRNATTASGAWVAASGHAVIKLVAKVGYVALDSLMPVGLPVQQQQHTPETKQQFILLWLKYSSIRRASDTLGVSYSTCKLWARCHAAANKEMCWRPRRASLSEAEANTFASLREQGLAIAEVAKAMRLSEKFAYRWDRQVKLGISATMEASKEQQVPIYEERRAAGDSIEIACLKSGLSAHLAKGLELKKREALTRQCTNHRKLDFVQTLLTAKHDEVLPERQRTDYYLRYKADYWRVLGTEPTELQMTKAINYWLT